MYPVLLARNPSVLGWRDSHGLIETDHESPTIPTLRTQGKVELDHLDNSKLIIVPEVKMNV